MDSSETPSAPNAPGDDSGRPAPQERNRHPGSSQDPSRPPWLVPALVAAIVLVAVLVWWYVFVFMTGQQLGVAREQYSKGQYTEANATLDALLRRDANNSGALLELARVKAATGDSSGALALYVRVIDAGGGSAAVLYETALLERLVGRAQAAASHFRAAWEQDRSNVTYANELGKTLVSLGQNKQAGDLWLGLADQSSRSASERKDLYVMAALAYREGGSNAEAKSALSKALVLAPKDALILKLQKSVK